VWHWGLGGAEVGYAVVETGAQTVAVLLEGGIPLEELSFGDVVVYPQNFVAVILLRFHQQVGVQGE
jgi:hypothetical protein